MSQAVKDAPKSKPATMTPPSTPPAAPSVQPPPMLTGWLRPHRPEDDPAPAVVHGARDGGPFAVPQGDIPARSPKLFERVVYWQMNPGITGRAELLIAEVYNKPLHKGEWPGTLNLNIIEAGYITFQPAVPYSKTPCVGCWSFAEDVKE